MTEPSHSRQIDQILVVLPWLMLTRHGSGSSQRERSPRTSGADVGAWDGEGMEKPDRGEGSGPAFPPGRQPASVVALRFGQIFSFVPIPPPSAATITASPRPRAVHPAV
jgi:hypothetical protein